MKRRTVPGPRAIGLALLPLWLLPACASLPEEETPAESTPTGSSSQEDALCLDAPVVTYDNFGQGFMTETCQSCHATTSPDRHGAPEDVYFDTREDVLARQDRILARATGEAPTMPPGGGVSEDDRWLVQVWLTCWE